MSDTEHPDRKAYVEFRETDMEIRHRQAAEQLAQLRTKLSRADIQVLKYTAYNRLRALSDRRRIMLGQAQNDVLRLRGQIKNLETCCAKPHMLLAQIYDQMCAVPRVQKIRIAENSLIISTDILFGKVGPGDWRKVGSFDIRIPKKCSRGYIRFIPREETYVWQNYIAPTNVSTEGAVGCFGDAGPPIDTALAQHDDLALTKILVRYLECRGHQSRLMHWPKVDTADVPRWYIDTFGL